MIANEPKIGILKRTACGHGIINTLTQSYIESKATGQAYCDTYCLITTEGEYEGERVRFMNVVMSVEEFKEELDVVSYG